MSIDRGNHMANYLRARCSDFIFVIADLLYPVSRPAAERFHNGAVRYSCICQCYKSGLCDALSRLPTRTIMLPWVILLIKCELAPAVHSATLRSGSCPYGMPAWTDARREPEASQ